MSKRKKMCMSQFAAIAALTVWSGVTPVLAGDTIPTWQYSVTGLDLLGTPPPGSLSLGKGAGTYTGTAVGQNPLDPFSSPTTIDVVVIPLIISISDGTKFVPFDPTAPDSCDGRESA